MTTSQRTGSITSGGWADDDDRPWSVVREHRLYCAALVAIVLATMFGAQWAAQPTARMVMRLAPSSASVEITNAGLGARAPVAQSER